MKDVQRFKGSIVVRKNGKIVHEDHNLVVTTGKNLAVSRLIGTADPALAAIGVGSGTVAAAVGDTGLGNQLARVAFDSAAVRSGSTVTMTSTFGPGVGTGTISEAGLFNATTGGSMFSRSTFTGIPKGASDSVAVTWSVTAQ